MVMETLYLSRRNLEALLSKLDRRAAGEETRCTIEKYRQPSSHYQQTMDFISVVAVEDDEYYNSQGRHPGEMHPSDEANLTNPIKV